MSISELHPHTGATGGPAVVVAEMAAGLRGLDQTWWDQLSDEDLVAVVVVAEQELRYGSTGDWLTRLGGLRRGQGRRLVNQAHALTGRLTATRGAMAAGRVSPEQAEVIVTAVAALPSGEAVRARGERALLGHAGALDASELARTGRHLVHVVDPDATRKLEAQLAREERAAHHDRFLSIAADGAGGVRLKGRGTAEDGALLTAALLPLTTPTPAVDDEHRDLVHDPRDHGARMWDALVRMARHGLDTDLPPESHGAPTRLTVTMDLQD
jgi:hypothetical protein